MKGTEGKGTERRAGLDKGASVLDKSGKFQSTNVEMPTSAGRASSREYSSCFTACIGAERNKLLSE